MTLALRVVLSILIWLLYALARFFLLYLPGLALCWWQSKSIETRPSQYFPGRKLPQFKSRWMWLYGNEEDGVDGLRGGDPAQSKWATESAGWSVRKRIWRWSALRNPLNNLRYVPLMTPKFHPDRIHFVGLDHEMQDGEGGWFFIWQGLYSAFRFETKTHRLWIGWCFKPQDTRGIPDNDTRLPRADFKAQLKHIA